MALDQLKLKIKDGEIPWLNWVPGFVRGFYHFNLPQPALLKPLLRLLYSFHYMVVILFRRLLIVFYREPLFRSRCARVGTHLNLYNAMPYVLGHAEIILADEVTITGPLSIISGRFRNQPVLHIGNRCILGSNSVISVNREVVIEDDVMISTGCSIADNDGHPRDALERARHAPIRDREMQPVRICRYAWLGQGVQVRKGVTIGEGAIIGATSVVITDIPPYCVAMGNPAEVYFRNVGRPRKEASPEPGGKQ